MTSGGAANARRMCSSTRRPPTFSSFSRSLFALSRPNHDPKSKSKSKSNSNSKPSFARTNLPSKPLHSQSHHHNQEEGVIQADFAFLDPKPRDFHGVKILLQTYLDKYHWDLSGFVDLILAQSTVGTVVKLESDGINGGDDDDDDEDALFSVVTALNLGRYRDHECIKELKKFLLQVCKDKHVLDDLKLLLGERAADVGLLVSQRVVNLPPQLLPPLYDALFDEVSWATEDEPTEELRNSFLFKSYLLITKFYKNKHADQRKGSSNGDHNEPVIYMKEEDEIFHKLSSWSFTFPLHNENAAIHELRSYKLMGLVIVVEADKVTQFREDLKSMVNDNV